MIDPVIFSIDVLGISLTLRWYGVFIATGILVAVWLTAREVKRRGENPDYVWDGLLWVIPAGIAGARLWYVANATLGGSRHYIENPAQILNVPAGGLHIYGAILLGALAAWLYARHYEIDMWLLVDAVAPALLLGQAVARPANFINQELYGPPTDLPWGISISAQNRIAPWTDLSRYPEATTRFHPTFAYEIIWNVLAAVLLLWLARRVKERLRPGAIFAGWLILEGAGRFLIEFFRPDQPRVPGTDISITRVVTALMVLAGTLLLLVKYERVRVPFLSPGETAYSLAPSKGTAEAPQRREKRKRQGKRKKAR
jgi:phosphatidylglycerol:prolipoprotein diacylglycerol transferase